MIGHHLGISSRDIHGLTVILSDAFCTVFFLMAPFSMKIMRGREEAKAEKRVGETEKLSGQKHLSRY